LSEFEAFCGWKPTNEIQSIFSLDPLKCYLDGPNTDINDKTLKQLVKNILKDSDENIAKVQEQLKELPKSAFGEQGYVQDLIPRLQEQYDKTDPGTLVAL
jgi:mannose-6-phosphate isomerase